MEKGMRKYINPNDENDIVCAKINEAPYINQYLDSDGNPGNPRAGRTMCGANTVAMLAAAKGKYDYQGDYDRLKTYTYQDNEIEITGMSRSCDWVNDIEGADMYNVSGVWSYVGYNDGVRNICNMSIAWRMQKYLLQLGFSKTKEGNSSETENNNEYYNLVKESIDLDNKSRSGFIIIENGKYKFKLTCFEDKDYQNTIECKSGGVEAVLLNGEPVKFDYKKDYEWAIDGMPQTGFLSRNGQSIIGLTKENDLILATTPGYYTKKGGIFLPDAKGGILLEDLANYLINEYNVVEAYKPDGGNEASIYTDRYGVQNETIAGLYNEIPSALFIFNSNNCPYE